MPPFFSIYAISSATFLMKSFSSFVLPFGFSPRVISTIIFCILSVVIISK